MILVSLGLLGLGIADLVRWSSEGVGVRHAAVAAASGAAAVVAVAALGGIGFSAVLLVAAVALPALWFWSAYDLLLEGRAKPEYALAFVLCLLAVLLALSGSADPIQGDLADWYSPSTS